jgi:hypothetical protein
MNEPRMIESRCLGEIDATGTFTGTWNGPTEQTEREFLLMLDARRMFGIDWWAERQRFTGRVNTEFSQGQFGVSVEPRSPIVVERSEWWRRWGFAIVKRLPQWRARLEG